MTDAVLTTPLHADHVRLGARMVPFAGYDMPVQYSSVIAEAKAVREGAGMFDVSHMARLILRGEGVVDFVKWVTCNNVDKLADGEGQYSLLPNENGGVVDDIIVYRASQTEFRMVVNAANHAKDVAWLKAQNSFGVEITDETDATAMIAVQGPNAASILAGLASDARVIENAGMFALVEATIAGVKCVAPRSGYTGEDGFELISAASDASKLWQALENAGVAPCGLGSRDTLRVEAGLPLYGHELTDDRNPITAGLGWVVRKESEFIGCQAIWGAKENGVADRVLGVKLEAKRLPMPGMQVYVNGEVVGEVCSGVVSPLLDCGIAFAFVRSDIKMNTPCTLDMRGKHEPAILVNKRFFKRD